MDKLLDREVHQLIKTPVPSWYYSTNPTPKSMMGRSRHESTRASNPANFALNEVNHLLDSNLGSHDSVQPGFSKFFLILSFPLLNFQSKLFVCYRLGLEMCGIDDLIWRFGMLKFPKVGCYFVCQKVVVPVTEKYLDTIRDRKITIY